MGASSGGLSVSFAAVGGEVMGIKRLLSGERGLGVVEVEGPGEGFLDGKFE